MAWIPQRASELPLPLRIVMVIGLARSLLDIIPLRFLRRRKDEQAKNK